MDEELLSWVRRLFVMCWKADILVDVKFHHLSSKIETSVDKHSYILPIAQNLSHKRSFKWVVRVYHTVDCERNICDKSKKMEINYMTISIVLNSRDHFGFWISIFIVLILRTRSRSNQIGCLTPSSSPGNTQWGQDNHAYDGPNNRKGFALTFGQSRCRC